MGLRRARYWLLGCCLLAGMSGCSFHRTGHGLIVDSHWSLEYRRTPWLLFRSGAEAECYAGQCGGEMPECEDGVASDSTQPPELLPWRSRLRERLAARLRRGPDSAEEESEVGVASDLPTPPDPVAASLEDVEEGDRPTSEGKPAEAPLQVRPLLKADGSDLVVD